MKGLFDVFLNLFRNPVVHKTKSYVWPLKQVQGDEDGNIFTFYRHHPENRQAVVASPSKTGFTLIELLVVVLVIGILSAVALPQYQLAVDKSRFVPYLQTAHSIRRAEEVYYLANASYTSDLGALDIDHRTGCTPVKNLSNEWQCPNGFFIDLVRGGSPLGAVRVALCPDHNTGSYECNHNTEAAVTLLFEHSTMTPSQGTGGCSGGSARGKRLCKALNPELLK